MGTKRPKNILIAPLDWGLGHTTRCVPLIRYLLQQGHHPIMAGNASQRSFISDTFGNTIDTIDLEGYNVTYSKWNRFAQMGLLAQLPAISASIAREYHWLEQKARELQVDGVISDNRYGLFHNNIPSIIITHQLQVLSGMGNIADRAVRRLHYKYLERFRSVWVADSKDTPSLGGKLSHPAAMPRNVQYIGLLSRFSGEETSKTKADSKSIVILLSGPEPQRSILSDILWQQALNYKGDLVFIEGSDVVKMRESIPGHITYHKRLANDHLQPILTNAAMVICRSGYSTIMDLVALGKKAIVIPTPGQTEQKYLASRLHAQGVFYSAQQDGFDLTKTLEKLKEFPGYSPALQNQYSNYKATMDNWLSAL